jgi:peptide deformylase
LTTEARKAIIRSPLLHYLCRNRALLRYGPLNQNFRAKKESLMAVRPMVQADNPLLRKKSKKVRRFGRALQNLIDDMVETMHAVHGLGLAAPQIGVSQQVIVIQLPEDEEDPQSGKLYVLCNPEIVKTAGEEESEEGCLSVPGFVGDVRRAAVVTVKGLDRHGKKIRIKAEGLLARAFQHEVDHINGVLYIDRVDSPEKIRRIVPVEEQGSQETSQEDLAL